MWLKLSVLAVVTFLGVATSTICAGYTAQNVTQSSTGLTANLKLVGSGCNIYGDDLDDLVLNVEYQTANRLHVQIYDAAQQVYQVPSLVLDPPKGSNISSQNNSELSFILTDDPFSFAVQRVSNQETIFNTSGSPLIFESQYLNLRTSLPVDPNIYGLGEDTDAFRRNTTNYTRTLWSRDAYEVPTGSNLYGNHPIYIEHRQATNEAHGVFLFNSNGMDIKINNTETDGQYLEYNTLGGIVDLYFMAGPSPVEVSQQYSEVVGRPVMMPYWSHGFHQCKYGYSQWTILAEVVQNYSNASIPLETMWTDIDYMDGRKVFTLDPSHFPLEKMQELVTYLHDHDQHYIMMVDPAVAYQNYSAFNNGAEQGAFLKTENGSIYQGVVWPGVTAFPDWMDPSTQTYWNGEFDSFFNADTGVNIDALWIDMNEASNFCPYPCSDPAGFAASSGFPPSTPPLLTTWPPLPGFPDDFQPPSKRQATGNMTGLPGRDLINPKYKIANSAYSLSNFTINTDLIHSNGLAEYDTHNLYGTTMSSVSRNALLSRRPTLRPMVITRSTFAGAGAKVGHWLGDNASGWDWYKSSISEIMAFAGIYQLPMVGADVCGYALNTTSTLCARWAMLGAFYPFYRNHASNDVNNQEFYIWPIVASAARKAIDARYRLLDYLYTAIYQQSQDGTPTLNPLFFLYPSDANTLPLDLQFFFGQSILVSPVTDENSTTVTIYLPDDQFYDFWTLAPVRGNGATVTLSDIAFDDIPLHIRGGSVVPMRAQSANTTTALRQQNFELVVAPGLDQMASGTLYLDDGESLVQNATTLLNFDYKNSTLTGSGDFGYATNNSVETVKVLGVGSEPTGVSLDNTTLQSDQWTYSNASVVSVNVSMPLTNGFTLSLLS